MTLRRDPSASLAPSGELLARDGAAARSREDDDWSDFSSPLLPPRRSDRPPYWPQDSRPMLHISIVSGSPTMTSTCRCSPKKSRGRDGPHPTPLGHGHETALRVSAAKYVNSQRQNPSLREGTGCVTGCAHHRRCVARRRNTGALLYRQLLRRVRPALRARLVRHVAAAPPMHVT